jgi:hypothetical protein
LSNWFLLQHRVPHKEAETSQLFRAFPKKFFVGGFIEHMGVFYATTIELLVSVTTPAPYVS